MKEQAIQLINLGIMNPNSEMGSLLVAEELQSNFFWALIIFSVAALFFLSSTVYQPQQIRNAFDRYRMQNKKVFLRACGVVCLLICSYFLYHAGRAYFHPHLVLFDKMKELVR